MSQLLESIRLSNHQALRLDYHQERMERACRALWASPSPSLKSFLEENREYISSLAPGQRYKLRLLYGKEGIEEWQVVEYQPKPIKCIKMMEITDLQYPHKFADRMALEEAYQRKGKADDVLILRKSFLSDTSYANVALLQEGKWYTPSTCLLAGTHRAFLLEKGLIQARPIPLSQLNDYEQLCLINAMLDWQEICLPMDALMG